MNSVFLSFECERLDFLTVVQSIIEIFTTQYRDRSLLLANSLALWAYVSGE